MNTPEVGDGYRLLDDNEVILSSDEVTWEELEGWRFPINSMGLKVKDAKLSWSSFKNLTYRRKISKEQHNNMKNSKSEKPAYIIGNDFISISYNGVPTTVYKNDDRFEKVKQIIKDKTWDKLELALNTAKAIAKFTAGNVVVFDGAVLYKGNEVKNSVVTRILEFMKEGFPYEPLVNFLEKLMQNPSERSKEQLYKYLELYKLPIFDDGDFAAYKSVTNDFKDHHTKTIDNSVGNVVKVPRDSVDDNPNSACSFGLHVGEVSYCQTFGDGIGIIVKINPKDVVSVPHDCSSKKMRVCEYKILSQFGKNSELTPFNSNYAPKTEQAKDLYPFDEAEVEAMENEENGVKYNCETQNLESAFTNEDRIRAMKGKLSDTEIRKEIREIYGVKKTQGNAIFNRIFARSEVIDMTKSVKAKKPAKVKESTKAPKFNHYISADKAYKLYKSGTTVYRDNGVPYKISEISYPRVHFRNIGNHWYIFE